MVRILIPKPVCLAQLTERSANNAAERWPYHAARKGSFTNSCRPQVNVVRAPANTTGQIKMTKTLKHLLKNLAVLESGHIYVHFSTKIVPVLRHRQPTQLAEPRVRRNAVFSCPRDIYGGQVSAKRRARLAEQVLSHL